MKEEEKEEKKRRKDRSRTRNTKEKQATTDLLALTSLFVMHYTMKSEVRDVR